MIKGIRSETPQQIIFLSTFLGLCFVFGFLAFCSDVQLAGIRIVISHWSALEVLFCFPIERKADARSAKILMHVISDFNDAFGSVKTVPHFVPYLSKKPSQTTAKAN